MLDCGWSFMPDAASRPLAARKAENHPPVGANRYRPKALELGCSRKPGKSDPAAEPETHLPLAVRQVEEAQDEERGQQVDEPVHFAEFAAQDLQ